MSSGISMSSANPKEKRKNYQNDQKRKKQLPAKQIFSSKAEIKQLSFIIFILIPYILFGGSEYAANQFFPLKQVQLVSSIL